MFFFLLALQLQIHLLQFQHQLLSLKLQFLALGDMHAAGLVADGFDFGCVVERVLTGIVPAADGRPRVLDCEFILMDEFGFVEISVDILLGGGVF